MDKDLYRNMKMVWYSNKFLFDLLEDSFRFLKIRSPPTGSKCVDGASIDILKDLKNVSFSTVWLVTLKIRHATSKFFGKTTKRGPMKKLRNDCQWQTKQYDSIFLFNVCVGPRATEDSGFLLFFASKQKSSTTVVAFVSYGRSMVPLSSIWIL